MRQSDGQDSCLLYTSSHINSYKLTGALEAVKEISPVSYAQGYILEEDRTEEALLKEAVEAAKAADVAVIFAGLPDAFESEGYDRPHMKTVSYTHLDVYKRQGSGRV